MQLDHAVSRSLVEEAIDLGLPAVMFDGSLLDYATNIAETARVVGTCHGRGVSVEAELGVVGGKGGVHDPAARTDPDQAAAFVAATGVDFLAVAVGTEHRMRDRQAVVDLGLVERLRAAVDCPLVLHGSSGVSDKDLQNAVRAGITKVNISTHLNAVFTAAVRGQLARQPANVDPRECIGEGARRTLDRSGTAPQASRRRMKGPPRPNTSGRGAGVASARTSDGERRPDGCRADHRTAE